MAISKSKKDAIKGISLIVCVRDAKGQPIEDENGVYETEFVNEGKVSDLLENDSVLFENVGCHYNYASQVDELLKTRGLHLASPDAKEPYRVTAKGFVRMWVAEFDPDGEYATSGAGITLE